MNRVLVTVLTWNRRSLLKRTLKHFNKYNDVSLFDFLVVDNGSSDDTVAWLKKHNYEVLRNKKNVGVFHATRRVWLEAHNRGYEFILNLQNDFPACHPIPLDDIFLLFETRPKVGFVQLNNKKYLWTYKGRKRVLKIKRRTHNSCKNAAFF